MCRKEGLLSSKSPHLHKSNNFKQYLHKIYILEYHTAHSFRLQCRSIHSHSRNYSEKLTNCSCQLLDRICNSYYGLNKSHTSMSRLLRNLQFDYQSSLADNCIGDLKPMVIYYFLSTLCKGSSRSYMLGTKSHIIRSQGDIFQRILVSMNKYYHQPRHADQALRNLCSYRVFRHMSHNNNHISRSQRYPHHTIQEHNHKYVINSRVILEVSTRCSWIELLSKQHTYNHTPDIQEPQQFLKKIQQNSYIRE